MVRLLVMLDYWYELICKLKYVHSGVSKMGDVWYNSKPTRIMYLTYLPLFQLEAVFLLSSRMKLHIYEMVVLIAACKVYLVSNSLVCLSCNYGWDNNFPLF